MLKILISIIACLVLNSCTISISQIHTQGQASDVIDEDQKANADIPIDVSVVKRLRRDDAKETGFCSGCKLV